MIAANPCFGFDFAAVAQVHAEIVTVRNRGAAILLVGEDLDEMLELADRILVVFRDRLVREERASEANLSEMAATWLGAERSWHSMWH